MTNISLPSPGSPRSRFPCFNGTMKMCDSLRPSRRASLCFAWQYQVLRLSFAPCGPGRTTAGLGFVIRSPLPEELHLETVRVSQVPGKPCCTYAVFFDPGGTGHTRP